MSRLTRRVAVKAKGAAAKTYADFQSHIRTLTTTSTSWSSFSAVGKQYTTAAGVVGGMDGSSWGPAATAFKASTSNIVCRIIQHALPSEAVFLEQVSGGRDVYFETQTAGTVASFPAVTRNGYTSNADNSSTGRRVIDLIRWDDTLKKAFRSDPSIGGVETEYTW